MGNTDRQLAEKVLRELCGVSTPTPLENMESIWPALERMAEDGATVVIKLDGERTGSGDRGRYSVMISGQVLGDDRFHVDSKERSRAFAEAIAFYARKRWPQIKL